MYSHYYSLREWSVSCNCSDLKDCIAVCGQPGFVVGVILESPLPVCGKAFCAGWLHITTFQYCGTSVLHIHWIARSHGSGWYCFSFNLNNGYSFYRRQIQITMEQPLTLHGGIMMTSMNTFGKWYGGRTCRILALWVWSPMYVEEDQSQQLFEGHWTLDVLLYAFEVLYIETEAWHNWMVHRSSRCFKQLQWPIQKSCNYLVEPKREKGYLVSESFMFCLKESISSCRGACSQSRSSLPFKLCCSFNLLSLR